MATKMAGGGAAPARRVSRTELRPNVRELYEARERVRRVARHTPLQHSQWLSDHVGGEVWLKLECWQRTNSFKVRGAYNAIASLDEATRDKGLVTASAGNHGQAVALAARLFEARATIYVPTNAPETKKARIRGFGAELREIDGIYDDAAAAARQHVDDTGAYYVHPFSDPAVVAGQGTVGLEIIEDLPSVKTVVVPVGGGGLVAGIGIALKSITGDSTRILGVQSTMTSSMFRAFEAGHVVETEIGKTLCDGLAGEVEEASFERARPVVDHMALVDEDDVAPAIRALYHRDGVVAEGAGAVGVAALLSGAIEPDGPTAVVISGGNIDVENLARIFSKV
ncbi:MAG TPA: threonine/serine dehydratase [Longimicrobiales bacterium]|nr:threonine/serine dehydratase [Longimicrobiales bacterium]